MAEPRVKINRMREAVIKAAYEWRAAEIHHSACILGVRQGELGPAAREVERTTSNLRVEIDDLHQEEKSLGLI